MFVMNFGSQNEDNVFLGKTISYAACVLIWDIVPLVRVKKLLFVLWLLKYFYNKPGAYTSLFVSNMSLNFDSI